jgi:hypothetical protein
MDKYKWIVQVQEKQVGKGNMMHIVDPTWSIMSKNHNFFLTMNCPSGSEIGLKLTQTQSACASLGEDRYLQGGIRGHGEDVEELSSPTQRSWAL